MATSIAVSTRSMIDVTGTLLKIRRISPINSSQWHLVLQNQNGVVTRITMGGSSSDITGTGVNQGIVFTAASIPSSISFKALPSGTEYSITIQDISPTVDFIAVTTGYSATSPIVLRLPPVTAHSRPIFIKLGRNTSASNDGVYIITRGDSFIDSASRNTESIGGTTYNHSSSVFIGGQSANGTAVNYPCITLFSDGSNWYIANYYPMNTSVFENQHYLSTTTLPSLQGGNIADTYYTNGINVFDKNIHADRTLGKNVIRLQTPSISSLCMIVYKGPSHYPDDVLIIDDVRTGGFIDGFTPNNPYIYFLGGDPLDTSAIVLFYDNTVTPGKWYVVGWFLSRYCDFDIAKLGEYPIPYDQDRRIILAEAYGSNVLYTLPRSFGTGSNPQVIIFKVRSNISGSLSFCTRDAGGDDLTSFCIGISATDITYSSSVISSSYSCVWFVSQELPFSTLAYYPVISYLPGQIF